MVALTHDHEFDKHNVSSDMKKKFAHIHVNETLGDVLHLTQPVQNLADPDVLDHKFKGYLDLTDPTIIPPGKYDDLIDPEIEVEPINGTIPSGKFKERPPH